MNGLCYRFDPDSKEYIAPDRAQESPLEPGVWLWPANTTTDEPPPAVAGNTRNFINSGWVYQQVPVPPVPAAAHMIAEAHGRINAMYTSAVSAMTSGYPEDEVKSWPKQEQEARDRLASPATAETPWINAAAAARGITKDDLVAKIIDNANQFTGAHGTLTGKRQALRDAIDALGVNPTAEQLDAIQW